MQLSCVFPKKTLKHWIGDFFLLTDEIAKSLLHFIMGLLNPTVNLSTNAKHIERDCSETYNKEQLTCS
jgi:hypothetical protein